MANFPRELELDVETEESLKQYLENELINHYAERSQFVGDLIEWQKDYWAKPSNTAVNFPFQNAANIIIPLTAIAVEAVHARTMTTMFALKQFVSVSARSPQFSDLARPIEQWLDYELLHNVKIEKKINDPILEIEKFGTGVGKVAYVKQIKTAVRDRGDGTEEEFAVVTKQGATVDCVPLSRFLMPFYATCPQSAPWVGEEHEDNEYEMRNLEASGYFRPGSIEKLEGWLIGPPDDPHANQFQRSQQDLENTKPHWPKTVNWHELWMTFDVDKSGEAKEIVVLYHRESRTILSIRYNWYHDLHRPYRIGNYFPVEHRWNGVGICKQNDQFQREVTTQHRQRLDNATLANTKMFAVSRMSNIGPREPIWPGKMFVVEDPTKEIREISMGEINPSAFNNETATLQYSYQRTGVNEVMLGMPQVGTPGTATSDLARIQEGNKKFDYVYRNIKNFTGEIVLDVACCLQQFGPKNLAYFTFAEGGALVQQLLTLPPDLIRDAILLDIAPAGQQENNLLDRQNWQQVFAMLQQYYQAMMGIAQLSGDPGLLQTVAMKGAIAGTEAMKQILESFDIRNIDRIILSELLNGAFGGGAAGVTGVIPQQGMVNSPQGMPPAPGGALPPASTV